MVMGWFKKGKTSEESAESRSETMSIKSASKDVPLIEIGQMAGKCLIATPFMTDKRFHQAVVYICGHSDTGAMGVVINHPLDEPSFPELLEQFDIKPTDDTPDLTIVQGGPVDNSRGFVLHSGDYEDKGTQKIADGLALSCSLEVLTALSEGKGPQKALLALGYTGWDAGQLESELADHGWIVSDCTEELLFDISCNHRWEAALGRMGIAPASMSHLAGRA